MTMPLDATVPVDASPGPSPSAVTVRLSPRSGVSGAQRVNFAVPLPMGMLADPSLVRVLAGANELPAARRALARYGDNTVRSVHLQVNVTLSGALDLQVRIGETPQAGNLTFATVESTLSPVDGTQGPRVWALLPATWLSASGVVGPSRPEAETAGGPLDAWRTVCDYARHNTASFLSQQGTTGSWLFDRGTALYRGYARRGDLVTLESAYREASIYRNGITGTGSSTRIGVPGASGDLKYHYSQGMAIHYLLSGDDRFRERAEDVARRAADLWTSPGYAGGSDFWTERHAGFALLAYVWAMIVSDDRAAEFRSLADTAVTEYKRVQDTYPPGYNDTQARCFAHLGSAHGEGYSYWGCSPWMSAILADGLDVYATERGGTQATGARSSIVKLGRILAREGRDSSGRPLYWMGVNTSSDDPDEFEEHWGESAYIVAMAWYHAGRSDAGLRSVADALVAGLKARGVAPHLRSFNWQCRSAVATPFFLR
jgi:hypothetical protein